MVYTIEGLTLVKTIETPAANPKGVGALSLTADGLVALPAATSSGAIAVHSLSDAMATEVEIAAHKSPLTALAFNEDASLLASASTQGTLVRVFRMPEGRKVFTLR